MAFPSPAKDYAETRLDIETICCMDRNCTAIETTTGYAVINRSKKVEQGALLFIEHCGRNQFARRMGSALITDDGEALEGEALDDVNVLGVVTHLIHRAVSAEDDQIPV